MAKFCFILTQSLLASGLLAAGVVDQDTYQFPAGKDPYSDRSNVARKTDSFMFSKNTTAGIPHDIWVIYPQEPGKYPWFNWFGGGNGLFPEPVYTDLMENMALKGFICTYTKVRIASPGEFKAHTDPQYWQDSMDFLRDSLAQGVLDATNSTITADTTKLGVGCHSSGCEAMVQLVTADPQMAQSYYYTDPVLHPDAFPTEINLNDNQNVVIQSTAWCKRCCAFREDASRLYDLHAGGRAQTKSYILDAGHCSILNYWAASLCKVIHFCVMDELSLKASNHNHNCVTGELVASFTDALFDRPDMAPYYTQAGQVCDSKFVDQSNFECIGSECA